MYFDFANTLVYVIVAILFVFAALTIGWLVRPSRPSPEKLSVYECGEETIGTSWVQFNVRFYVIALIFLIFDVEIAMLFPWTTVFKVEGLGAPVFAEMLVFIGVLVVAFAYVWAKKDLQWLKTLGPSREAGGTQGGQGAERRG